MSYKDLEQQRKYQREYIACRRNAFFADKSCVICGSTDRMELDHINRSTKVSHRIWSWSEKRRVAEIAKCQVLCHNCHEEKTIKESRTYDHGLTMYKKYKCRCSICKTAKSVENAKRYQI